MCVVLCCAVLCVWCCVVCMSIYICMQVHKDAHVLNVISVWVYVCGRSQGGQEGEGM